MFILIWQNLLENTRSQQISRKTTKVLYLEQKTVYYSKNEPIRSGAASCYVTGPGEMERVSHRKLGNFRLQAVVNKDGGGGGVVPLITCWARCGSLAATKTTTERGNHGEYLRRACVSVSGSPGASLFYPPRPHHVQCYTTAAAPHGHHPGVVVL